MFRRYHTTASLPQSKVDALAVRFVEVQPQSGLPAGGYRPGDSISFLYKPTGARWWAPNRSYLRIAYTLSGAVAGNPAANIDVGNHTGPTALLPATLFEQVGISLAGKSVELLSGKVAQQAAFIHRSKDRPDQINEGAVNGWPTVQYEEAAAVYPALARQAEFIASQKHEFNWVPPLALFQGDTSIPSCSVRLDLQIHANAFNRSVTDTTGAATVTSSNNPVTASSATNAFASIQSITLMACELVGHEDDILGLRGPEQILIPLKWITTNISPIQSSPAHIKTVVPSKTFRITSALQRVNANAGTENHDSQPCLFHPGAGGCERLVDNAPGAPGTGMGVLNVFQIRYAGNTGPDTVQYRPVHTAAESNLRRAYVEYLASQPEAKTEPETYAEWLTRGPLLSYASAHVKPNADASVDVETYLEVASLNTHNLIQFAESDAVLALTISNGEATDATIAVP